MEIMLNIAQGKSGRVMELSPRKMSKRELSRIMKPKGSVGLTKEIVELLMAQKKCPVIAGGYRLLLLYFDGKISLAGLFESLQEIDHSKFKSTLK